jgi:phospholipase C
MTSSGQPTPASALDNIAHVIVLMFENRSFDHLLGAMPGVDGVLDPCGKVSPGLYNTKNPLAPPSDTQGPDYNPPACPTAIILRIGNEHNPNNESAVFCGNSFNHDFSDAMLRDLYGPGTTGIVGGQPQNAPATTYPPTNSGFLSAPGNNTGPSPIPGVMSYFAWNSMQVFHALAQNFVTCDAWHCDMPGHTAPNRAFMHCATTGDLGIDDNDDASLNPSPETQGSDRVNRTTIYEQIQNNRQTWKMYWMGSNCDTDWLNTTVFSQQYSSESPTQDNVTQVPIANLFSDITNGTLPFYSFIMCWNDIGPDTSMHPNSIVESAENLLACVYNALQASDYWSNTLLIVNFDENGGMYDHKSVPAASPPDENAPVSTWQWNPGGTVYSFDFSVLGPRTPVLLISPWLQAGICSDQYQNSSILRFVQDLLTPAQPGSLFLTQRDLNAPSIAPVFDYTNFGVTEMRTDCPSNIPLYTGTQATPIITEAQITGDSDPTLEQLAAPPAPHICKITKKYLAGLPGHPDSGKPITRTFATVGELRAYAKERRDVALAEIRKGSAR